MKAKTITLQINEYCFRINDNPYEKTGKQQAIPLSEVAHKVSDAIDSLPANNLGLLVRGVQSQKHEITKDLLKERILENGIELEDTERHDMIFATPYSGESTILQILEGFHKYKPKCEERPQYIVDIWMIFDLDTYDNIEYLHPRHNVIARDKWKRKNSKDSGLVGVVVIDKSA